jgi:adenylosuccinate synthase
MSNEKELKLKNNEEETCVFNEYQKDLRLGELDYDLLNYALILDGSYVTATKKNLIITCLDQIDEQFKLENIKQEFDKIYGSYSSYSKDFKEIFLPIMAYI